MSKPRKRKRGNGLRNGLIVAAVVVFVSMSLMLYRFLSSPQSAARHNVPDVVQLKILQPPPPPPPPPPPKMAEPPKMKEPDFKAEHVDPKPQEPPPGPPAVDAAGSGPGDAFGLQGRPGGSDYLGDGNGSGGGSRFGWYATMIQQHAQDALQKQKKLNGMRYHVAVQIWLANDGSPTRVELISSTGKPEVDAVLEAALREMPKLSDPPPKDMPQPIVMQVTSS